MNMNPTRTAVRKHSPVILLFLAVLLLLLLTPRTASAANNSARWKKVDGKYYYVYRSGRKATGFLKRSGNWYHFSADGSMSTGWFTYKGGRYFAQTSGALGKKLGALKTGYRRVGGSWYYFEETGAAGTVGRLKTGWVKVKAGVFYYGKDGTKLTGFHTISGKKYYFRKTGSAKTVGDVYTGFKTIGGKKYYFRKNGEPGVYGAAYHDRTVRIRSQNCTFDSAGVLIKTTAAPAVSANDRFIEKVGKLARKDMKKTGVLASVTIAQAIVESAYGTSTLARYANNLFGMKAALSGDQWGSKWSGRVYRKSTLEYGRGGYYTITASFRRYSSWANSIRDHSAYLSGARLPNGSLRYKGITTTKSYRKAARIIKNGGYATAPNYVSALCNVIERYDLTRFDKDPAVEKTTEKTSEKTSAKKN